MRYQLAVFVSTYRGATSQNLQFETREDVEAAYTELCKSFEAMTSWGWTVVRLYK